MWVYFLVQRRYMVFLSKWSLTHFYNRLWGIGSDVIGRKISWLSTLFIGSIFMMAVGGAPTFEATGILLAFAGVGIGGSLPVDGALLCECECCQLLEQRPY